MAKKLIYWFKELRIKDVPLVGGKNAALGEMYRELTPLGIKIPNGFAVTADAFRYFIRYNKIDDDILAILKDLNTHNITDLHKRGNQIRNLIKQGTMPGDLAKTILDSYNLLSKQYKTKNVDVAVRSSATAEDLPGASFAGQQETFLNIHGSKALLSAVRRCFASLFTDRAISYRYDKGFDNSKVALSVGIQKMVRSDKACSGVAFTIDTETGFDKAIIINGVWGLGELIVQGIATPDEFVVFKPSLEKNIYPILSHRLGPKQVKMVYDPASQDSRDKPTKVLPVLAKDRNRLVLNDKEIITLAKDCLAIEKHFSRKHKKYTPMDIEWAKDGLTNELFIVQARPETVHASHGKTIQEEYTLKEKGKKPLVSGISIGTKIATGKIRVIKDVKDIMTFKKGELLVTEITDPDWEPIMKIASGIITDKGGRTSHAAIVSRELGVPCIVGSQTATKVLKTGQIATLDCSGGEVGKVYKGALKFEVSRRSLKTLPNPKVKISLNIGSPEEAFRYHHLPVDGIGLGRLEFIIASHIKVHPNILIDYAKIKSGKLRFVHHSAAELKTIINKIDKLTLGYKNKSQFYVNTLAEGIARLAATFWPNDVIIRFSDFKTNEYAGLLGGSLCEPHEENPMIGWRGASRYYDPRFRAAFGLECQAIKKVRETMGLTNVIPMIPFCRTVEEGKMVLRIMAQSGLPSRWYLANSKRRHKPFAISYKPMPVYVMAEIPTNAIQVDSFLDLFDGMSIGSNDLTQLVVGLDRDSGQLAHIANENNEAVKAMIKIIIDACNKRKKYVGICGQAPSDYPEFAKFLKKLGIKAISLNPDSVVKTILALGRNSEQ